MSDHNFYKEVDHSVYQFVDDSSSSLGFNNKKIMENYLQLYLKIMENFYNINKLKLNPSKTKYLINCNKSARNEVRDFKLTLDNEILYPDGNVRILGVLFSSDNTYTVYCNDLIAQINYRFVNLMKVKSLTDQETRLRFCNAFLLGKINYALMLFYNGRKDDLQKLHTMYMKIARNCHKAYPFKVTNSKVLAPLKWLSLPDLIKVRVLNFTHSIIVNKKPEAIYSNLIIPTRSSKNIRFVNNFKINNIFPNFIKLYNELPGEFRLMNRKGFKLKIKKQVLNLR